MTVPELAKARRKVGEAVEKLGDKVSCRGFACSGCCRGEVRVRPDEVERIVPLVSPAAWLRIRAVPATANRKTLVCPLLDPVTRACTVYVERPLVCRGYTVATPPEWCWPEKVGIRDVGIHAVPLQTAYALVGNGEPLLSALEARASHG